MNQKKNKMLLILIIALLVILLIGGILYAVIATDLFKNKKDLFFKYTLNTFDEKNGIINNNLEKYLEKKKNTPYENNGKYTMDIGTGDTTSSLNSSNITFSGQVDSQNSKIKQDINLNYSESVVFPLSFRKVNTQIGMQTKYVGNKYLVIDTENSNNTFENTDISSINETLTGKDKIQDIKNIELTNEEKERIKNTYIDLLKKELGNDKFSKVKENGANGYKLTLTGEEIKNIITKILEKLKEDQSTIDKINEYIKTIKNSSKITANNIDEYINQLESDTSFNEEKIEITVFTKKRKVVRLVFSTNNYKIDFEKVENAGDIKYQIALESLEDEKTAKIYFNFSFSGIASMQTINEVYEISIETEEGRYKYKIEDNINFIENAKIDDFTDENSIILTNYNNEKISGFLNKVINRIQSVNKEQMEEIGLEENNNPFIEGILAPIISIQNQTNSFNNMMEAANQVNEEEIADFNKKYEVYEATKQLPQTIKGLLSTIQLNNEEAEDDNKKIKEINFNGEEYDASEQNIAFIKDDIKDDKEYRVDFERDQDSGIIYRVVISER